ncbi:glycosyltransferase [Mucilaginibacter xinganensis]|uniref:Glycosyl transferase group 1 n=1 Tax=Mucilaginibacter xinganensis TaxID=1234841 RepID=A0A223P3K0_9SPHI|nr:glycosyltransferase [Mucilaginibacter xinganensis]ASU36709.1 glycosyl transferase group 1 [Mucilaginibacter xinganensis]
MNSTLLVFDSHPVQYRAPIWQAIENQQPGSLHVVYASDCSLRGHSDHGFGKTFAWDEPMLSGYNNTILNCENGVPLSNWQSLTGKGVRNVLKLHKPAAVLLTGLNYKYDLVAYFNALILGIPVWLRCETQDEAMSRTKLKAGVRGLLYRLAYLGIGRFLFIGELNKKHYLTHGVPAKKLSPALYGTVNRFESLNGEMKQALRSNARQDANIPDQKIVIGFSGKFISKKNPAILFQMLDFLPGATLNNISFYFIGSGPLEQQLLDLADEVLKKWGIKTYFAGFVNQSKIAAHYLAIDVFILPSKKMGETWGLVVNEALQAGCSVIVSSAVGSSVNFKPLQRFRIFEDGNAKQLAHRFEELLNLKRDFNWAESALIPYSIEVTAKSIINTLQ